MALTRWDPIAELEEVSNRLNRVFEQPPIRRRTGDGGLSLTDWTPAMDVEEIDGEYLIKADLPDVKKEDVRVEIQDGVLSVSGERHQEKEEKGKRFHRIERAYGRFERRLSVPMEVDTKKIAAEFKDGVLRVHLPKSPSALPQSVAVKVN
jgi:HSP20 family protein